MKFIFSLAFGVAVAGLVLLAAATACAQFSIPSFTVDGGGGASSGGGFSLRGTIGQPDAGEMRGGAFALAGGFWNAVPAPASLAAPTIFITGGTPGFVVVSWLPATPGFVLQFSDVLAQDAWTNAPSGASNPVSLSRGLPARFYRAARP